MTLPQRETPMTVTTSRLDMLEWKALEDHQKSVRDTRMIDLFDQDPQRFDKFHITHDGLLLDYSKTLTTKETMLRLFSLARGCGLEEWRDMMFAGGHINNTEDRPALHAGRWPRGRFSEQRRGRRSVPGHESGSPTAKHRAAAAERPAAARGLWTRASS